MQRRMDRKERLARDLAETLADEIAADGETDVEPDNLAAWPAHDVYEWLEAWGFEWNGSEWERRGEKQPTMTNLDTLLSQALALVNEDQRGRLADIIEAIIEQRVTAANDMWVTRLCDWESIDTAVDAIGYVVHGPAFGSVPDRVRQVHELIWAARARAGVVTPTED